MDYSIKNDLQFIVINQDLNNLTLQPEDLPKLIWQLQILESAYRERLIGEAKSDFTAVRNYR